MDLEAIKRLLTLMAENDLVELELEEEGKKVRLRKGGDHAPVAPHVVMSSGNGAMPVAPAPAGAEASAAAKRLANVVEVRSPLVGTFYAAPKPGADPFVNTGDVIGPDKVVCIVEAMKVMNEIKAGVSGTIRRVLVENASPVEFGQPLFLVELG